MESVTNEPHTVKAREKLNVDWRLLTSIFRQSEHAKVMEYLKVLKYYNIFVVGFVTLLRKSTSSSKCRVEWLGD